MTRETFDKQVDALERYDMERIVEEIGVIVVEDIDTKDFREVVRGLFDEAAIASIPEDHEIADFSI